MPVHTYNVPYGGRGGGGGGGGGGLPDPVGGPVYPAGLPYPGQSGYPPASFMQTNPPPGYPPAQPVMAQPGYPQPGYGYPQAQPVMAQPVYAQPAYAQPAYAQVQPAQPGYYGQPPMAQPYPTQPMAQPYPTQPPVVAGAAAAMGGLSIAAQAPPAESKLQKLKELKEMVDAEVLTQEEFDAQKKIVLEGGKIVGGIAEKKIERMQPPVATPVAIPVALPAAAPAAPAAPAAVQLHTPVEAAQPAAAAAAAAAAAKPAAKPLASWPTEPRGGWYDELLPREAYPRDAMSKDTERLRRAVTSSSKLFAASTVEKIAVDVLGPRSNAELQQLQQVYKEETKHDMREDLKGALGGTLGKLVRRSLLSPVELDAKLVKDALKGVGTDEKALAEVLCTISESAMLQLHAAYPTLYKVGLVEGLEGEWISSDLKQLLVNVVGRCQAGERDHGRVELDAEALFKAGEGRFIGKEENTFVRIFSTRTRRQLQAINEAYTNTYGHSLQKVVQKEFSGHLKWALYCLLQPPQEYFAEKLYQAMKGLGSDKDDMTEIVAFRKDRDLSLINEVYVKTYQKTLLYAAESESSGDYKRLLTAYIRQVVG